MLRNFFEETILKNYFLQKQFWSHEVTSKNWFKWKKWKPINKFESICKKNLKKKKKKKKLKITNLI